MRLETTFFSSSVDQLDSMILLVVFATFKSPRRNALTSRGSILKSFAPPVTEMTNDGC